jgi:hypothetical protein
MSFEDALFLNMQRVKHILLHCHRYYFSIPHVIAIECLWLRAIFPHCPAICPYRHFV